LLGLYTIRQKNKATFIVAITLVLADLGLLGRRTGRAVCCWGNFKPTSCF